MKTFLATLIGVALAAFTAQAQFTANFQWNSSEGGAVDIYTGAGVSGFGAGAFWNTVPGPNSWRPGTYSSTNSLADDGVTDTGISWTLVTGGSWSYPSGGIALLNSYANSYGSQTFTFNAVPDGTYNLVLFGLPGAHSAAGTTFTVDGASQAIVEPKNVNTSFLLNTNYVVFSNLVVTGGSLSGTWGPTSGGEGHLNGAQLQRVSAASLFVFTPRISPTNYVETGMQATLKAEALGTAPLQYQWLAGSDAATLTNIPGAIANPLAVDTTGLSGTVSYAVVVTDSSGSVTSPSVTLTISGLALPSFEPNPPAAIAADTAFVGGQVTFTTTVNGSKPVTCQWQVNKGSGFTNLAGAAGSTLTLTDVQLSDAGAYRIHAANSVGVSDSSPVTLTVLQTPAAPAAGSFAAGVLASDPIGYWRLSDGAGTPIVYDSAGNHHGLNNSVLLGAPGLQSPNYPGFSTTNTAGSFDGLSSAITTGAGLMNGLTNFTLLGWFNPAGGSPDHTALFGQNDAVEFGYSDAQGVNLWIPTTLGGWVNPRTGPEGFIPGQWYFVALVADGTNVTIYVDGVQRAQSANVGAPKGTSTYGFNIGGAGVFDASGNYFNGLIEDVALFGTPLTPEQLRALLGTAVGIVAPAIITQPASQNVFEGRTVQFTVGAGGVPLYYQWQAGPFGGPYTNLADGGNITGTTTSTLRIANVNPGQAGDYVATVTNSLGSAASLPAVLTVTPMPAGQWVVNFDFDTAAGGFAGTYIGPGVLGNGTFWNPIPGPDGWGQGTFTSSSGLADDGTTDTGISLTLTIAGNWSKPANNMLLDDFAEALNGIPQPFTFNNLVNGVYNLVLFGINGGYNARGTIFTLNGVSQSTTNSTDSAFVEGDNYVIYHNLLVTDGTLRGTWSSNPIPFGGGINDEGDFCGAQLQYVGSVLPQVRLTTQFSTGGQLKLEWSQGRLLETTNLATGTWIAVPGAATSYTVAPTETHKFYRVQVSP
ncbi:MAG TPA: LamG-like jellyroll fold domain-containing protein [Verrucomicrobiae bacterium]